MAPRWPYPQSKIDTERLIREEHGPMPIVLLRIAGVYDDYCHSIPLANQIQRIHERTLTSRVFPGHISHGQSFVHLEDLVEAFVRVIHRRSSLPAEATILLGESEEPVSYDELQHQFGRLLHDEEWQTTQIPKAMAKTGAWVQDAMPGDDPFIKPWMIDFADDHYALDIARARSLLGWEPMRSLRKTLPKMIAALKADPIRWYGEHSLKMPGEVAAQGRERPDK